MTKNGERTDQRLPGKTKEPVEIRVRFRTSGGDINCLLREPTLGQLNEFRKQRYPVINGIPENYSLSARVALFDLLLSSISNKKLLEKLPMGVGTGANPRLPDAWKAGVIFQTFETPAGFRLLKKLRNGERDQFLIGEIQSQREAL